MLQVNLLAHPGIASKASSVGAKTVNGPSPESVSSNSAVIIAVSVLVNRENL